MSWTIRLIGPLVRALGHLPAPAARVLAGGGEQRDGQRLDDQLALGMRWGRRFGPRLEEHEPARARAIAAATLAAFETAPVPMARTFDERAPGPGGSIPVRVLVPRHHDGGLLVYFHGGGGVIGSVASYERVCRYLAEATRCAVASVDYRLAPEHPYPAAIDDALAVWPWAVERAGRWGADPARAGAAGDSFGGYLVAWIDRRGRRLGLPRPRAQALIYPMVDMTHATRSYQEFADGYVLTRALMEWFRGHHAPDPTSWRPGSPWFETDLSGAPATLVVTAGFDPLRDEGAGWARRLAEAGAAVDHRDYPSLVHGFINLAGGCRAAQLALDETAAWLAAALARPA